MSIFSRVFTVDGQRIGPVSVEQAVEPTESQWQSLLEAYRNSAASLSLGTVRPVNYGTMATLLGIVKAAAVRAAIKTAIAGGGITLGSVSLPTAALEIIDGMLGNYGTWDSPYGIDMSLAESRQYLTLFVAAGILTQTDADTLVNYSSGQQ